MGTTIDAEAEGYVRALAAQLSAPRPRECLLCYMDRMLEEFGCDETLRFAQAFRGARAAHVAGLEKRLGSMGGYCDCEVFWNAYAPAGEGPVRSCAGVRAGSTQPCAHWERRRRQPW